MNDLVQPRLLRMKQLTQYCGLSRAYLYQQIASGGFPPGHTLSNGSIRFWELSEVDEWLDLNKRRAA